MTLEEFKKVKIEAMKALCKERQAYFDNMYDIANTIGC